MKTDKNLTFEKNWYVTEYFLVLLKILLGIFK